MAWFYGPRHFPGITTSHRAGAGGDGSRLGWFAGRFWRGGFAGGRERAFRGPPRALVPPRWPMSPGTAPAEYRGEHRWPGRPRIPPGRPQPVSAGAVLGAIWTGALGVAVWPVIVVARLPGPAGFFSITAHVTGMLAGYGVVVLIGLMSRATVLERGVGADRLARWHGHGGRAVVSLILVHDCFAVAAWARAMRETVWFALGQVLRMPFLIAATVGTAVLIGVAVTSVRLAKRRMSHEKWHTVHLLTYIAVALGFVHQLSGPDLAGYRVLQVLWALLYTLVFALILIYRMITPARNATRHRMRVESVVPEGTGVVSIYISGCHLRELQAESGQFFRWRFFTPDLWWSAHPYSLSAAPADTRLRLTVKALGDGSRMLQSLEPGTWVAAEGPYGAVTASRRNRRNVLLVAGGIGITPMRALLETMPSGRVRISSCSTAYGQPPR